MREVVIGCVFRAAGSQSGGVVVGTVVAAEVDKSHELGATARLLPEFAKRGVKVAALSVDPLPSHHDWVKDIEETQVVKVDFPIIADADRSIALAYDMIHPNASEKATVRSLFVIGPDKKIKLIITYPASTGRNFQEILRVIDSLQLTAEHSVATAADWKAGEDVVFTPALSDAKPR